MAEYSRIAKGHFTSTGAAQIVQLPFQPDRVEFVNYSLANTAATSQNIISAQWDVSMGQGFAVVQGYNATPALIYDTVTAGGISSFAAGKLLQYGATVLLGGSGGIAKTNSTTLTVTTTAAHGLTPGNWVIFQNLYQTSTTGMQQLAGIPFEVLTVGSTTTFTVGWVGNAANLTAITTGGLNTLASFKQVLFPALYVPGIAFPWTITLSAGVVTVTTTAPHNFQVGQEIAFRIPSVYGGQELNELPSGLIPGSPKYYYVTSVARDSFTFNYGGTLSTFSVAAPAFTSFNGLNFAQVLATGDVNTGGTLYSGGNLYPSPSVYSGYSLTQGTTINGPALLGAYVNNTAQGFIVGAGAGTVLTTGSLVGANTNVIYWRAYLSDYAYN